ncbi:MAG: hypothetical protein ACOY81_01545 [Bacillota bacterium]|uniref:hypothetical protein n=1 Tax=Desulfurispora thermophila TaxID=265470 RepID=UPI00037EF464|nr:hypothetical protein [Desulfurispora thermophila]
MKRKLVMFLTAVSTLMMAGVATAAEVTAKCTLNGTEVPVDALANQFIFSWGGQILKLFN